MNKNIMFKNVFLDKKRNIFHIWYVDGSYESYECFNRSFEADPDNHETKFRDIYGMPVREVFKTSMEERDDINNGIKNYESDIPPEIRILSKKYEDVLDLKFTIDQYNVMTIDIEVEVDKTFPEPALAEKRINLITVHTSFTNTYTTFALEKDCKYSKKDILEEVDDKTSDWKYVRCEDEVDLLNRFFDYFEYDRPDIISGHNSNKFDLPYIINRASRLGLRSVYKMSPVNRVYLMEKFNEEFKKTDLIPVIGGVACLDHLELYKKFNLSQKESYKLGYLASVELGKTKLDVGSNLANAYKEDWDNFVKYNIIDVNLVVEMIRKLKFIENVIGVCAEARIPLEYFFVSKRVILGFMMTFMHREGLVINHLANNIKQPYEGAYIRANPGFYKDVVSFDFRSMYPSIIMSANISPETKYISDLILNESYSKSVVKNVFYSHEFDGIIPRIVKTIVLGRNDLKALKKKHSNPDDKANYNSQLADYYDKKQNAYKIFANSIYGLLGNPYFQFYDVENAASITGIGNKMIRYCIDRIIRWFDEILPNSEKFKAAFGEYANVTIKGCVDPKYREKYETLHEVEGSWEYLTKYKRVILAHTDSFFLDFSDIYAPFKDKMTLTEFTLKFEEVIFGEIRSKILKKWAKDWNYLHDYLDLKLEKCCNYLIELTPAHYICYLEYDEGDNLINSAFEKRFKPVGVEINKSDTPIWSKDKIKEVLKALFNDEDRNSIIKRIYQLKKNFKLDDSKVSICKPISINTLEPTKAGILPAPRKGARIWNRLIELDPDADSYEPISEGSKVKWLYVKSENKFNTDVITFPGTTWPTILDRYFEIDYEKQFEKTFKNPLEKIIGIVGWGNIFEGNIGSMMRTKTRIL